MNKSFLNTIKYSAFFLLILGCSQEPKEEIKPVEDEILDPIFKQVHFTQSGLNFINSIREDQDHNFFNYNYIYNGAGLATGDFNNDGLLDLYMVSNQNSNKLFVNEGGLKFKELREESLTIEQGWSNGVNIVDVNADGFMDIYLSRGGTYEGAAKRKNLLFINNGDLTFTESAAQYGLADTGYGIQSYFFDYDRDGDLDMYMMNHRDDFVNKNTITFLRDEKPQDFDPASRDRLYRNDNGKFRDVSDRAGIVNSAWGLSVVAGDFNEDGWEDIYVANDYLSPDLLYINNKNGTFTESIEDYFQHTSFYSMGSDFADIDQNGHFDLFTLDMAPEDHVRSKRLMASMSNEAFRTMVDGGLQRQYMLNTLQYNHGEGLFSEVAQLSGINKTDWSWTALFGDYDIDGKKDLFVTNGIRKDITDNDAMAKTDELVASGTLRNLGQVLSLLPNAKLQNPIYQNKGGLKFERANTKWGMKQSFNSNGAIAGDFDNDGDLEIVLNNMDLMTTFYNNLSDEKGKKLNKLKLQGPSKNRQALGTTVTFVLENGKEIKDQVRNGKGYLSNSDPTIYYPSDWDVEKLYVQWPTGKSSIIDDFNEDTAIDYEEVSFTDLPIKSNDPVFSDTKMASLDFKHQENAFDDFIKEILLPHRQSEHGPFIAKADVNNDGAMDLYIGGASGQAGALYLQGQDGFSQSSQAVFSSDKDHEDMHATFFDADNDLDLDLYVVSGSGEFYRGDADLLKDKLYLNDGRGSFSRAPNGTLPNNHLDAGSKALANDFDQDGDMDLIVLNRNVPGEYPMAPMSRLYVNNDGIFSDGTDQYAEDFKDLSVMVTDGSLADVDGDGREDLVLVGEWSEPKVLLNTGDEFELVETSLPPLSGWWRSIEATDLDNDGDLDFVVGNIGLNNKYQPKAEKPLILFYNDFDQNGIGDIVLSKSNDGELLPVRGRECSSQQMPFILDKFDNYEKFANANLTAIYSEEGLAASLKLEVNNFKSGVLINNGDLVFDFMPFPTEAQFGATNDIVLRDIDGDGYQDIIAAGNFFGSEVETVRYDSNFGSVIMNKGGKALEVLPYSESGLALKTDVRDLEPIEVNGQEYLIISSNNEAVKTLKFNK